MRTPPMTKYFPYKLKNRPALRNVKPRKPSQFTSTGNIICY